MNKKQIIYILVLVIFSFIFFSCTSVSLLERSKTISVNGNAILSITPDSASMNVRVSESDASTKDAQKKVNEKISAILLVLNQSGVLKEDIQTMGYEFSPEYQYIENKRELVGQRVSQSIYFVLRNIDNKDTLLPAILDRLADVSNITLGSITFSKEDMSGLYDEVRRLAMEDALHKASLYANVVNLQLGDPLLISDYSYEATPVNLRSEGLMMTKAVMSDNSPEVPVSAITIQSSVQVTFKLK